MKFRKIYIAVLGLVFLIGLNISITSAAEIRFNKDGGNVSIGEGESIKNLYTAGNLISINGDVEKDLYAAGNVVSVNGDVETNVLGLGSNVTITGNVGGTVHAAGGSIVIEGDVGEDLFLAGGNILIAKTATVSGDLYVGGGTVDIEGEIKGNLMIGAGDLIINSKIGGAIVAQVDKVRVGPDAIIMNGIKYKSPKEAEINDAAQISGSIDYTKREGRESKYYHGKGVVAGILSGLYILKIIVALLTGLVFIYFFNKPIKNVVTEGMTNIWENLGIGFATLFLTPIVILLLLITVIGIHLAGILTLIYILFISLSVVISSIMFGSWVIKMTKHHKEFQVRWQELAIGVILLAIITLVPFIGWLIGFAFMLIAYGAIVKLIFSFIRTRK